MENTRPQLIWDEGEVGLDRASAILAQLQSKRLPSGVVIENDNRAWRVIVPTRNTPAVFQTGVILAVMTTLMVATSDKGDSPWLILFLFVPIFVWVVAMSVWGRVEIESDGREVTITSGVWKLTMQDQFYWHDLKSIRRRVSHGGAKGGKQVSIELEAYFPINFGRALTEEKVSFVIALLLNGGPVRN
jgi:hypothetical protein